MKIILHFLECGKVCIMEVSHPKLHRRFHLFFMAYKVDPRTKMVILLSNAQLKLLF